MTLYRITAVDPGNLDYAGKPATSVFDQDGSDIAAAITIYQTAFPRRIITSVRERIVLPTMTKNELVDALCKAEYIGSDIAEQIENLTAKRLYDDELWNAFALGRDIVTAMSETFDLDLVSDYISGDFESGVDGISIALFDKTTGIYRQRPMDHKDLMFGLSHDGDRPSGKVAMGIIAHNVMDEVQRLL